MAEQIAVPAGFGIPPVPTGAVVAQHSRETPQPQGQGPNLPPLPGYTQQPPLVPGFAQPAPAPAPAAAPAPAPVAAAPDPTLLALLAALQPAPAAPAAAPAPAAAETDAEKAMAAREAALEAREEAQLTAAIHAAVGGEANWNAAVGIFASAPPHIRTIVSHLFDSKVPSNVEAGIKTIAEFAQQNGGIMQPAGVFPGGAAVGAANTLDKIGFQEELQKLDKHSRSYEQQRAELFVRRKAGKDLGR